MQGFINRVDPLSTLLSNSIRTPEHHLLRKTISRLATVDDNPRGRYHEPHTNNVPRYHWGWGCSTTWVRHVLSLPEQGWHDRVRESTPRSRCWSGLQSASVHGRSSREEPDGHHVEDTLVAFRERTRNSYDPDDSRSRTCGNCLMIRNSKAF
jgi:hypothetical protein